jgi:outer membrane protein OmpA-like peptidoglycan-associated protein
MLTETEDSSMRHSVISVRTTVAVLIASGALAWLGSASAQEVKSLRGKPSSDMILQALTPAGDADAPAAPAPSHVRRRGLSLSSSEETPAAVEPAAAPAAAAPTAAAQAASAPAPKPVVAAAPMIQQARPQPRALDLDIQFQFNSDQLTNDGKDVLDQLATALKSQQLAAARSVILEGHADAKGNAGYNQALSLKRAQSARTYLATRHGITVAKLKAVGKGSSEPADPSHPEDEVNRRVRVIVDM